MSQCDALDGLSDGIITNPALCNVDFSKINISAGKRTTAAKFYSNWTASDGSLVFPGYAPGAEEGGIAGANGFVFPFTQDYFKYSVLNFTSTSQTYTFTQSNLESLVKTSDQTNPGGMAATNYNMSPYFGRGGKLLHYVGTHDALISYGSVCLRSSS